MNYFLIKRKFTNSYYSVRDDKGMPSVIAFSNKQRALAMSHVFKTVGGEKQQLMVEKVPHDYLVRTCTNSALGIILYNSTELAFKLDADVRDIDVEDARFYLRNKFLYST